MLALTRSSIASRPFGVALRTQLASRPYATAPPPKTDGPAPYVPPAAKATASPLASTPDSSSSSNARARAAGRAGTGLKATLDDIKAENDRKFASLGPAEKEAQMAKEKRGALINIGLITAGVGLLAYSYIFPPPVASPTPHSTAAAAAGIPQKPTV